MYEAGQDPYCYPGTAVLKNLLDLRTQPELDELEASMTAQRADEPLPAGALDAQHYLAIHHHLFQDVFDWAGNVRTIRIAKEGAPFCYPENIEREMRRVFSELAAADCLRGLAPRAFAEKAAHFLAELNAVHPFREGNGRTQNVFLSLLAQQAGHPLDFKRLDPAALMQAMIASFQGDEAPLARVIVDLMEDDRGS